MNRLPANSQLITRALEIAEKRLGIDELSRQMDVSPQDIRDWQLGSVVMPVGKFMLLVDILTGLDEEWLRDKQ